MFYFTEDHYRITKVKTADGRSPLIDETTGKAVHKIVFAPYNRDTKKLFEEENTRLPNGLKMKIELVKAYKPVEIISTPAPQVSELEKKIAELEQQNKQLQESLVQKESEKANVDQSKTIGANGSSLNGETSDKQTKTVSNDKK